MRHWLQTAILASCNPPTPRHRPKLDHTLRDRHGHVLPDTEPIAKEIHQTWSGNMASSGPPPPKTFANLNSFFGSHGPDANQAVDTGPRTWFMPVLKR